MVANGLAPAVGGSGGPRIAVVGAYGSGKTTLAAALCRRLGLPRAAQRPMDHPVGAPDRAVEDWTPGQLIQLSVRRYADRVAAEAVLGGGFVSDGSALHEWTYMKTRLVAGTHPECDDPLEQWPRAQPVGVYEEVADELGLLAFDYAAQAYDLLVHVPVEFPLAPDNRPVNDEFRRISDRLLIRALGRLGLPVLVASGPLARRVDLVAAALHPAQAAISPPTLTV
jgi:AAA domain